MRADKTKVLRLLKTARGQIDGLIKMVEDDRYCIDVSNQLLAVDAIIRSANREVLAAHIHGCVQEAVRQGDAQKTADELSAIIEKLAK